MTADLSLKVSRHLPFAPERVFDAWLDPVMMQKFLVPGPGMTVPEASNDPRVGGRFRVIMKAPDVDEGWPHEGEYLEIDRASRLRFTWVSPYSQEDSEVTLDLEPNEGGTDLTLTHVRFPSQESRDNHEGGWTLILQSLEGAL
ncbi:SRPBCC domain-containing protein [Shimia sp.]|uniref:SRPBCC family protein n=1 Tax=Shimia sp. TaxID=1954381 RepID=UPI0032989F8F